MHMASQKGLNGRAPAGERNVLELESGLLAKLDLGDVRLTVPDGWEVYADEVVPTSAIDELATLGPPVMVDAGSGLIDEQTAVTRVAPAQLDELLHPIVDPSAEKSAKLFAKGLPAGPGGACGQVCVPECANTNPF